MVLAADIAHLLRRTEFIARPQRMLDLSALALTDIVDNILDFAQNANPQVPAALQVHDDSNSFNQQVAAYNWWLDSMATRARPFQEKMTLFWHGHFTSEWDVVGRTDHMTQQNQLYRNNAIGNLITLTQAMALEPAMLLYLSNGVNVKLAPNQNFARELMELFLLGVGNYAEDDVATAAYAWTGYNYDTATHAYEYRSSKHDTTPRSFFGTTKAWDGPGTITEILQDNVGKRLIAARYIAKRLWEFLAYPRPADNIVTELGDVFIAGGMELKPLLQALLNRPEFYSPEAKQGLVRTPTEWAVAILASSGLTSNAIGLYSLSDGMGQTVFNPPNVSGWKNNNYWMTTSARERTSQLSPRRSASLMRANGGFDNAVRDVHRLISPSTSPPATFGQSPRWPRSTRAALAGCLRISPSVPPGERQQQDLGDQPAHDGDAHRRDERRLMNTSLNTLPTTRPRDHVAPPCWILTSPPPTPDAAAV